MLKIFPKNSRGKDLIVGDIHGQFGRLSQALLVMGFDPRAGDRLFSVGDLVDRGPDSMECLQWLQQPWFHAVKGNHEMMAMKWAEGTLDPELYRANGGEWNLKNPQKVRDLFAKAFSDLPLAIELATENGPVGIVHACCPYSGWTRFKTMLTSQHLTSGMRDYLVEEATTCRDRIKEMDSSNISDVRAVVVGHTVVQRPTSLGNTIFIETGAWIDNSRAFTFLDAHTLRPTATACVPA